MSAHLHFSSEVVENKVMALQVQHVHVFCMVTYTSVSCTDHFVMPIMYYVLGGMDTKLYVLIALSLYYKSHDYHVLIAICFLLMSHDTLV